MSTWRGSLRFFGACTLVLVGSICSAQSKGDLRLYVRPTEGGGLILDGVREQVVPRTVTLTGGPHHFVFWAPGMNILDTVLQIRADTVNTFYRTLKPSPEYERYAHALNRAKLGRAALRYTPLLATLGTGWWAYGAYQDYRESYDALQTSQGEYDAARSPSEIVELKEGIIPARKKAFAEDRQAMTLSASIAGACLLTTAVGWILASNIKDPPPFEDKEKIRFEGLALVPPLDDSGAWMASLQLRIR